MVRPNTHPCQTKVGKNPTRDNNNKTPPKPPSEKSQYQFPKTTKAPTKRTSFIFSTPKQKNNPKPPPQPHPTSLVYKRGGHKVAQMCMGVLDPKTPANPLKTQHPLTPPKEHTGQPWGKNPPTKTKNPVWFCFLGGVGREQIQGNQPVFHFHPLTKTTWWGDPGLRGGG